MRDKGLKLMRQLALRLRVELDNEPTIEEILEVDNQGDREFPQELFGVTGRCNKGNCSQLK